MKTILCFGDSNTWGHNPRNGARYPGDVRWTGVLRGALGSGYDIIEEGLCGRTTCWDDPVEPVERNGRKTLPVCLDSHKPLDLVIIMLGTNDLKVRFSAPPADIARGAGLLLDIVSRSSAGKNGGSPFCLLVSPPHLGKEPAFDGTFGQAREKSAQLSRFFRREAEQRRGCFFFDAAEFIETSDVDGVHLDPGSHGILGETLAPEVRKILADEHRAGEMKE